MAALRSALVMLGRRGFSGSSAATSMGGRGLSPPPLHPASVRNLQNWRHFSNGSREPADKAESVLQMWWQRAKDRVNNADPVDQTKAVHVYGMVVMGAPILYLLNWTHKWV